MTFRTWLAFTLTEIALCFSPGPAVRFVIGTGLRSGARRSLAANAGILTGNATYFALSALGVGAPLLASAGVEAKAPLPQAAPTRAARVYGRALALQPARQIALFGATSLVVEFLVRGLYGAAAGAASDRLSAPRWRRRLGVASGIVLIAAGLRLAGGMT